MKPVLGQTLFGQTILRNVVAHVAVRRARRVPGQNFNSGVMPAPRQRKVIGSTSMGLFVVFVPCATAGGTTRCSNGHTQGGDVLHDQ